MMIKKVVLTGSNDGLGAAFGRLCVENGISVVAISRKKPDYAANFFITDLSQEIDIKNAADHIAKEHADFDTLINCAGVYSEESLEQLTYDEIERVMKVNVIAPAFLTGCLMPVIKQNGADIMTVGSTVGTKAYKDQMAYGMSKWATRGLSANLQMELKDTPSRVIQFNPGGFRSSFVQKFTKKDTDLSKYMRAEDVAGFMLQILQLPKSLEVSEVVLNRK